MSSTMIIEVLFITDCSIDQSKTFSIKAFKQNLLVANWDKIIKLDKTQLNIMKGLPS